MGNFAGQVSEERLADAIAMRERRWGHFKQPGDELSSSVWRMPHELAAAVMQKRCSQSEQSAQSRQSAAEVANARPDERATDLPSGVQQRYHVGSDIWIQAR